MYETKTKDDSAAGPSLGASAIVARGAGKAYRIYNKPVHRLWDLDLARWTEGARILGRA